MSDKRAKNWTWAESFELLRLMETHGRNWEKLLDVLHAQHLCTGIMKPEKIRQRYNTLSNKKTSPVFKNLDQKKFKPSAHASAESRRREEQEFTQAKIKKQKEQEEAKRILGVIEARETLLTTENTHNEKEIREYLQEKADQRRLDKDSLRAKALARAEEEQNFRSALLANNNRLVQLVEVFIRASFPQHPVPEPDTADEPPRKRQRTTPGDE